MGAFRDEEEEEEGGDGYGAVDEGDFAPMEEGAEEELGEDAEDDGHRAGGGEDAAQVGLGDFSEVGEHLRKESFEWKHTFFEGFTS